MSTVKHFLNDLQGGILKPKFAFLQLCLDMVRPVEILLSMSKFTCKNATSHVNHYFKRQKA